VIVSCTRCSALRVADGKSRGSTFNRIVSTAEAIKDCQRNDDML